VRVSSPALTSEQTAAIDGASPAFAVADPVSTILASSASGHYERHPTIPTVVRLLASTLPIEAIADAKANPPGGKTWVNGSALTSAVQAAGYLQMTHNVASTTDWTAGTQTQPVLGATYTGTVVAGVTRSFTTFVQVASTAVNTRGAGLLVYKSGALNVWTRLLSLYDGGAYKVYADTNSGFTAAAVTSAEWTTGVWLRIRLVGGTTYCEYATGTTRPASDGAWTLVRSDAAFSAGDTLIAGRSGLTLTDTSTAFAPKYLTFDDSSMASASDIAGQAPANGCTSCGYVTSPDTLTVIASADLGTAATPTIATLRTMLADASNRLPGDAATWTFGITGSASASPAAPTTLQSAAAVVLKNAGTDTAASSAYRYWAVYAKCTSNGSQSGSLDTSLIRLAAP
jgi:hypothetical protein